MRRHWVLTFVVVAAALWPATPAAAGGGGHGCTGGRQELRATRVTIRDGCFQQTVVHVATGDTVTWVNDDGMAHNVLGGARSFGDHTGLMGGESYRHTFDEPGTFPYYCSYHPGMVGAVVVEGAPVVKTAGSASGVTWFVTAFVVAACVLGIFYVALLRRPANVSTNATA